MDSIAPRLAEKVVLKHWDYLFIIYYLFIPMSFIRYC